MPTSATATAPAGVGNIGVGFDLLGHSILGPSDRATVRRIAEREVRVVAVRAVGDVSPASIGVIPFDTARNTAGRALHALREGLALGFGFEVELDKGIPIGAGLGGSAASCVAALVAANALLDAPMSREALYPFAMEGEYASSRSHQGDNVGPMLVGGVVLATATRLLSLRAPAGLHCVVVHPDQVLETRRSREVLAEPFPLSTVVAHGARLAQFIVGLERGDLALLRDGLQDVLVEPRRAALVPGFDAVKSAAMDHAAIGASLSGAGPSVFAWFASEADARVAAPAMQAAFADAGFASRAYVCPVNGPRAELD
ncbi:homoserine kinase [Lysobacter helvus]|uniref:Homoserine kinase n=2 Tax=Lysobacteraceae TaxID=32033 RepID=A0ABN6FT44_9GAMM|nr:MULTISPECIES: homoserine kinase [Lysobacter]BCT92656.1 homoserine kinase [Lysobacter caseinilyticus]BCT95809.1 homoserine kinase [Lysobacter helvus]